VANVFLRNHMNYPTWTYLVNGLLHGRDRRHLGLSYLCNNWGIAVFSTEQNCRLYYSSVIPFSSMELSKRLQTPTFCYLLLMFCLEMWLYLCISLSCRQILRLIARLTVTWSCRDAQYELGRPCHILPQGKYDVHHNGQSIFDGTYLDIGLYTF
jgi:hypothetical protein